MQNDDPEISRRYVRWHRIKTGLERSGRETRIKEGEIYWAGVGQNVGSEVFGKSDKFSRPVLVYRKLGRNMFMAIPLSTRKKTGTWYVTFKYKGRSETALLNQAKTISIKRLYDRIGEIGALDYQVIRKGFMELYG